MSRPALDLPLAGPALHVTPWHDPVVDLLGHDPRSAYVERFWLASLGPSCTFLLRRIATGFDDHPDGFELDLEDTARAIGLGTKRQENGPFHRALARIVQLRVGQATGAGSLAVRHRLPPLTRSQVERLPTPLRDEHHRWTADTQQGPTPEQRRTRARRLALSLLELGETPEAAEQQLHRWKVHPALAHEALRWAQVRRDRAPIPPPPKVFTPTGDAA